MPCAPVPLCTARSSLNEQTSCFTSATKPCGPHTTTADSPHACSSDLRMISRGFGLPEKTRTEGCISGLGWGLDAADDDWDEGLVFNALVLPDAQQEHVVWMASGDDSSTVLLQQHAPSGPQALAAVELISVIFSIVSSGLSFSSIDGARPRISTGPCLASFGAVIAERMFLCSSVKASSHVT